MQYSALLLAGAASLAAALPAQTTQTSENVSISNFTFRKNPGPQSVSFTLSTEDGDLDCASAISQTNGASIACNDGSDYRFTLNAGTTESSFELAIHHILDPSETSRSGQATINVYCHAGGNGQEDFICPQTPIGEKVDAVIKQYGS